MFIFLIFSTIYSQYGYQTYQTPFNLVRDNTFCKNRDRESSGELSVADVMVLENPTKTVQSCAQMVEHFRQTLMCSETFFASANQCACLRPGRECKQEASETGLSMYQLTVLGGQQNLGAMGQQNVGVMGQQNIGTMCANLRRDQCDLNLSCFWKGVSCVQTQLEGARAAGQPFGSASAAPYVPGAAANMIPGSTIPGRTMPGTTIPGSAGVATSGLPMHTLVEPPKLIARDAKCDEEIEEGTGQSNMVNLSPSLTLNDCQAQAQDLLNRGTCTTYFVYHELSGFPGDCACVRASVSNGLCDVDDHIPGYAVYQLKPIGTGFYPQGNPAQPFASQPGMQAYPAATGSLPYGANAGQIGAYGPGYVPQAGAAGAHAGAPFGVPAAGYQATPGYGAPSTGFQTGYGTSPQAYTGGRVGGQLKKSHDISKPASATIVYAPLAVLTSFSFGVAVALCSIFCRNRQKQNNEHLLFIEENTKV